MKLYKLSALTILLACQVPGRAETNKAYLAYKPSHIFMREVSLQGAARQALCGYERDNQRVHSFLAPFYQDGIVPPMVTQKKRRYVQRIKEPVQGPEIKDYSIGVSLDQALTSTVWKNTYRPLSLKPSGNAIRSSHVQVTERDIVTPNWWQGRDYQQHIAHYGDLVGMRVSRPIPPHLSLSVTPWYQASHNDHALARYLFPNAKNELIIKGAAAAGTCDISGTWLLIAGKNNRNVIQATHFTAGDDAALFFNEYSSKIRIKPTIKQVGTVVQAYKTFDGQHKRLWGALEIPIVHIEHALHLQEYDIMNNYTHIKDVPSFVPTHFPVVKEPMYPVNLSVLDALQSARLHHGKLSSRTLKKDGVADLSLLLGYTLLSSVDNALDVYGKMVIPTSSRPRNEYLFEPTLGNAGRVGFGAGARLNMIINKNPFASWKLLGTIDYTCVLGATENRSFDLIGKPWSRFMLVHNVQRNPGVWEPAMNYVSQDVSIKARHDFSSSIMCEYKVHNWLCNVGYNLGYQRHERLSPKEDIASQQVGLSFYNGRTYGPADTYSHASINQHMNVMGAFDVPRPVTITNHDIDWSSGMQGNVMSHAWHIYTECMGIWRSLPYGIGIGSSYEFGEVNNTVHASTIWLSLKCSW